MLRFQGSASFSLTSSLRKFGWAALLLPLLAPAAEPSLETFRREIQPVLAKYCFDCHGGGVAKGGVTLDEFSTAAALRDPKLWSHALRNVRAGIMPPADEAALPPADAEKLMQWIKLEGMGLDPAKPDPGRVTVRRLNRVEYRNTIRDLLGVDFDTQKEFPADDSGHGFDNIADVLTVSPMLLERYLDAAQTIVAGKVPVVSRVVPEVSIPGRRFATVRVDTTVPAPPKPETPVAAPMAEGAVPAPAVKSETPIAATVAQVAVAGIPAPAAPPGRGRGRSGRPPPPPPPPMTRPAPLIENEVVELSYYTPALVAATHRVEHAGKYQLIVDLTTRERYQDNLFDLNRCRLIVRADGQTLLEQDFVREGGKKFEFSFDRDWVAGDHEISFEIVPVDPQKIQFRNLRLRLNAVVVRGPFDPQHYVKPKGYEAIFPRDPPADVAGRRAFARELLGAFAARAYRRPVDPATVDRLVAVAEGVFGETKNTFEAGIAQAMVAVLASPRFLFREEDVLPLQPGETYVQVEDHALASRLSYFFWSSMPDAELLRLAGEGRLRAELPAQMRRLLGDRRALELVRNFTGQWLQARDILTVPINGNDVFLRDNASSDYDKARATFSRLRGKPESERTPAEQEEMNEARRLFTEFNARPKPQLTEPLRRAMQQETEMVFAHILKEDRSLLELIESDYTFVNDVLATHYGIADVKGGAMRKIQLAPESPRGGVLTQGTVLAVTSNPTRTSPVKRGVFILEAILGTPPAPPPPNIPSLEDAAPAAKLKTMSLRETLALHATDPKCASCHSRMDPLGLALENFNALGTWRTTDAGQPVQAAGKLITGEAFADVRELKHILATAHRRDFYYCLTEKLLTYALGRGLEYYDTITVDRIVAQLEASGGKPSVLLRGIVESAPFQQRRPPATSLATGNRSVPAAESTSMAPLTHRPRTLSD